MNIMDKLRQVFNRDTQYIIEYLEDEELAPANADLTIPEEDRVVIAVTLSALASGSKKNADYRIKSIRRVR